ncbi:phage tail protein I [Acinetobacter sp. WZC-1]|uniref:phage tail protein I n=1 Tax=Acinetobacter sp. WZC-1 TaxID=3459034 RepID=UPI00403D8660
MSKLLAPNATKLEKNIEQLGEKISTLPVPFINLHRIDRCPITHLPWLAWEHRVEYWRSDWSEHEKRSAITESKKFNEQRGTRASLQSLLNTVITEYQLKPWHAFEPKLTQFTFYVLVPKHIIISVDQLQQMHTAVDATKSQRDLYAIYARVKAECKFNVSGTAYFGEKIFMTTRN